MTTRTLSFVGVLAAMVALAAQGGLSPAGYRRSITPATTGGARLDVDVPLLLGSSPAVPPLADLRLFDPDGREVPYLLIAPPAIEPQWVDGMVLAVASTKKTSGFEVDLGEAAVVDGLRIEGLPAPFLKRALLEGSGDREHWTVLASEATLFDLPAEKLKRVDVDFGAGDFRYLRVTWDDTNSGRVPPPMLARARRLSTAARPRPLSADIPFERLASEPGKSRYRLRLPGRHLPVTGFQLEVDAPHVMRRALVTEPRFNGEQVQPSVLGEAILRRVTRDDVQAEELTIPVTRGRDAELRLVVDDGNNPPLELRSIKAVFAAQPTIFFESDGRPLTARYGRMRAEVPRYDLEAARSNVRIEEATPASWGDPSADERPPEAPTPAMARTGASLDQSSFTYSRLIPAGPAGLVAVSLDAAVLARAHSGAPQFADVRVLDGSGRQVPYVIERRDEPLIVPLALRRLDGPPEGQPAGPHQSWYALALPQANLPPAHITIETSARVFRREVSLMRNTVATSRRPREPYATVTASTWVNTEGSLVSSPLQLSLPPLPATDLFLMIDEGDNVPLPVDKVTLLLPAYRLRFFRPDEAALTLVYGRDNLAPPEYDLALLAAEVLASTAQEAPLSPAEETAQPTTQIPSTLFWGVLVVALLVLLATIARLVRSEPANAA